MTNRRKEIAMRYSSGEDRAIKEVMISEDDTARAILLRLKAGSNFHLADVNEKSFGADEHLFGYVPVAANPPYKSYMVQR
jgi:predicted metalloprotease